MFGAIRYVSKCFLPKSPRVRLAVHFRCWPKAEQDPDLRHAGLLSLNRTYPVRHSLLIKRDLARLGQGIVMPTHSEALFEAYASCPPGAQVYHTLEIWQASFDQAARVVANVGDDIMLGIENGAPRDGGSMVTFIACPFTADYPEQRERQPPSCKISIDHVARELVPKIRAALDVRQYIRCSIANNSAAS